MKYTHKIILAFLLLFFALQSCGEKNKTSQNTEVANMTQDSLGLILNISKFEETKLTGEAEELVRNWPMYLDLKDEIFRFKRYNLQDVISNISTLEKAVDSLQKTIPTSVDTFPVTSRINVLNTKAKYMLLLSEKQKPKLHEIKVLAEEYPLEFNALNIQLNEIFIKLPEFEN